MENGKVFFLFEISGNENSVDFFRIILHIQDKWFGDVKLSIESIMRKLLWLKTAVPD